MVAKLESRIKIHPELEIFSKTFIQPLFDIEELKIFKPNDPLNVATVPLKNYQRDEVRIYKQSNYQNYIVIKKWIKFCYNMRVITPPTT